MIALTKKKKNKHSAGATTAGASSVENKKHNVYYAWLSAAIGVLLLILWAWVVLSNGFQRWLAPIDLNATRTERPATAIANQQQKPPANSQSATNKKDEKPPTNPRQDGRVRDNMQALQGLQTIVQQQQQALQEIKRQLQQTQQQLAELTAAQRLLVRPGAADNNSVLAATLSDADVAARLAQFDIAQHHFERAHAAVQSWHTANNNHRRRMATAITTDMQAISQQQAFDTQAVRKEISILLNQLMAEALANNDQQSTSQQSSLPEDGYYQKARRWLHQQLDRMVVVRHRHFLELHADSRVAVIHSLMLARIAVQQQEAAIYRAALNQAADICRQAGADTLLARVQQLAAREMPLPYQGTAMQLLIELNKQ